MARRLDHQREHVLGTTGALPADVQDLPTAPGEAVVAVLVAVLGGATEVELAAVGFHTEPDRRERQVKDAGEAAVGITNGVLAYERRQFRRLQAVLDQALEP
jgi:hypothetical protein